MHTIEYKNLDAKNIEDEHICCAISDKKSSDGYEAKKQWLKKQFKNGYRFRKLDVRGKVFIEYQPAEKAWMPLNANGYMLINCFWVSGQYKKQGYGKALLQSCLDDAAEMKGVIVVTGNKKKPFMSDPKFFKKQGFEIVDSAEPHFQLWCKNNDPNAKDPSFEKSAKRGQPENKNGIVAYYSNACPFTEFYINGELRTYAEKKNVALEIIKIKSKKDAKLLPIPWIINSIFYEGIFVTHEIKADKKLNALIDI